MMTPTSLCVPGFFQEWLYETAASASTESSTGHENAATSAAGATTITATGANNTESFGSTSTVLLTIVLVLTTLEFMVWSVGAIYNWCQLPNASEGQPPQFWWIRDHIDDDDDTDDDEHPLLMRTEDEDGDMDEMSLDEIKARDSRIEAMIQVRSWGGGSGGGGGDEYTGNNTTLREEEEQNQPTATTTPPLNGARIQVKSSTDTTSQSVVNASESQEIGPVPSTRGSVPCHKRQPQRIQNQRVTVDFCDFLPVVPRAAEEENQPLEAVQNYHHHHQQQQQQEDQDGVCAICLTPYRVGDIVAGSNKNNNNKAHSCQHVFHKSCLVLWLQRQSTCPCCRQEWQHYVSSNNNNSDETSSAVSLTAFTRASAASMSSSFFFLHHMNVVISILTTAWPDSTSTTAISTTTTTTTTTTTSATSSTTTRPTRRTSGQ
jgi:hypothetical protein